MPNLFCPKCGSILMPDKSSNNLKCSCGYCAESNTTAISDKIQHVEIVEGISDDKNPIAVHDHICSKCGYNKAQLIEIQAWISDEDTIVQWKCGVCGFVEQEAAKST